MTETDGDPSDSEEGPAPGRAMTVRRVPAVTRAIAILRLLGDAPEPIGVHAIADRLGIVPSTCLHILRVLVAEELATFDTHSKKYALGAGILTIARGLLRTQSFGELVRPELDALSRRFGATAIGVEATGLGHMIVVAISRPAQGVRLHVDVGSRYPALISATGRCVAAFGRHRWSDIERRFRALRWARAPSWEDWRAEVEQTRAAGFAVDAGCYIEGVTIIAAPVFAPGVDPAVPAHFIVAVGVSEGLQRTGHAELGKSLREAAAHLAPRLAPRLAAASNT